MRSQHPTDILERENEALRRFLDEKDRIERKEKMPKRLLRWETKELLRAFKRLSGKVPKAARPHIARFLWRWKGDFGRQASRTMMLEWARIDGLISTWQLVVPKEEQGCL